MLSPASNRFVVLNVKTVPCPDTRALAPPNIHPAISRPALHKIGCISVLVGYEEGGRFSVDDLLTTSLADHDEADMIGILDRLLPSCRVGNSLITFNGADHDLRMLMLRACALWMVPLNTLPAWTKAPAPLHVDLYGDVFGPGITRWSLPDIAAAHGLSTRPSMPNRSTAWLFRHKSFPEIEGRSRLDVAAIFIAYAAHRSFLDGYDGHLLSAWTEIGRLFEEGSWSRDEPNPLAGHNLVDVARRAIEPSTPTPAEDPF
jgi:hypothetical protein